MKYIKEISNQLGVSETEYLQEQLDLYRKLTSTIEDRLQIVEELVVYYDVIKFRDSDKVKSEKDFEQIRKDRNFCNDISDKYFYLNLESYDDELYSKYIIQRNLLAGFVKYYE